MKRNLASYILHLFGWKVTADVPDIPKCVICVAPHTSNWDFILGKLAYLSIGRKAGFLMKKSWFFFPINILLNWMGGVPVDRKHKSDLIDQLVEKYKTSEKFAVAITPEATRKKNHNWKSGFYYIALKADVPIALAYIDYGIKEVGIKELFIPSGDYKTDLKKIQSYYREFTAKYPENFSTGK